MTGLHLLGISRERPIVCLHYRLAQPVAPAASAPASREKVSLPMRRSSPAPKGAISSAARRGSVAPSSRTTALGCTSASVERPFRDGFARQPPSRSERGSGPGYHGQKNGGIVRFRPRLRRYKLPRTLLSPLTWSHLGEDGGMVLQQRVYPRSALVGPEALQLLRVPEQRHVCAVVERSGLDTAVAARVCSVAVRGLAGGK